MDLHQLQSFMVVAEEEDFAMAAKKLGVSPEALGSQLGRLEDELGWRLMEPGADGVTLTRAGRVVAWEGRKLMRQVEVARERMRREIEGDVLRVGYAPSLAHGFLGVAIERFVSRHSGFRVELADATREEMMRALLDGSMDLAVDVTGEDPGIDWTPLVQSGWLVAFSDQHPLAGKAVLTPADLDGERLLLFSKAEYPGYWAKVMEYLREHRIRGTVAGEFDGRSSLLTALEADMGVALVGTGDRIGGGAESGVVASRLEPPPEMLCVGVGAMADRNQAPWVSEFIEELQRASAEENRLSMGPGR